MKSAIAEELKELMFYIKIDGLHDGFGVCMAWLFAIADYQTEKELEVNSEWEFRQSPMGVDDTSHEYQTLIDLDFMPCTIKKMGEILWRYRAMLIQAKKDY